VESLRPLPHSQFAMAGTAYIGTSGWNYKSWRDGFYGNTPQKQWLRFCAERFTSIEVNAMFYRLQEKVRSRNGATRHMQRKPEDSFSGFTDLWERGR
jgi:hypothetical protein